jgi:membrane-bound lytic murein transglycosylase A
VAGTGTGRKPARKTARSSARTQAHNQAHNQAGKLARKDTPKHARRRAAVRRAGFWAAGLAIAAVLVSMAFQLLMNSQKAALSPASFADLPGWEADDHLAALKAFLRSCAVVVQRAERNSEGPATAAPAAGLAAACRAAQAMRSPARASAKAFFEAHFVPHRVVHEEKRGLLTGYYEPVLEGSRTRAGKFQTPIYRRPPDLVNVVAESERASQSEGFTHLRKTASGTEPYATREEIEEGALAGQGLELLYLADPVDAFFMQVQGSGRIKLPDGTSVRVNYDGKNGYPYTSIGRYLVDEGLMQKGEVTLQSLRKWLHADPERGRRAMWQNKSFIFFRELDDKDADGPQGALTAPLTPGRSLAVDTAFHRLGSPIYVASPALTLQSEDGFHRLMIAQDVGSAIKGPERGDIYYGSGDKAGRLAGTTNHKGSFFVLLPRAEMAAASAR